MDKTYKNILNSAVRSSVAMSLLLSVAACGKGCKDGGNEREKASLKFTLKSPGEVVKDFYNKPTPVSDTISMEVIVDEGKDDLKKYKLKVEWKAYTDDGYTTEDKGGTNLKMPVPDGLTLEDLFKLKNIVWEKGEKGIILFQYIAPIFCTSKSGRAKVSILNEKGEVVGGPVNVDIKHQP